MRNPFDEMRRNNEFKAEFEKFFLSPEETMAPWKSSHVKRYDQNLWHIKNGGTVLLVAHIDTVLPPCKPRVKKKRIKAIGLDDRLGVYMAIKLMENLSGLVDVLITDDEEIGLSSAELMTKEELFKYNVIIGLDRRGTDFVSYGMADKDLINAYKEYADYGFGSFSDIAYLEDSASCGCINVGIGYYKAHEKDSYAKIAETRKAYSDVMNFIIKYKNVKFKKKVPAPVKKYKKSYGGWYGHFNENAYFAQKTTVAGSSYDYSDSSYETEDFDVIDIWDTENQSYDRPEEIRRCLDCDAQLIFDDEFDMKLCTLCQAYRYPTKC
jgi:hypothetical protein